MNNLTYLKSIFSLILPPSAYKRAKELQEQYQFQPEKSEQVYLNALAVWSVNYYCDCMGIETHLEDSDSFDLLYTQTLLDTAYLELPDLGKIECRPVLPTEETCYIPAETWEDRIGYLAVKINKDAKKAVILGFYPPIHQAEMDENIPLSDFQSLDSFLDYLDYISAARMKSRDAGLDLDEELFTKFATTLVPIYLENKNQPKNWRKKGGDALAKILTRDDNLEKDLELFLEKESLVKFSDSRINDLAEDLLEKLHEIWGQSEDELEEIEEREIEASADPNILSVGVIGLSTENCEFERYEPHQLERNHVVAQFLDNQWVPRHLIKIMIERGLSARDVQAEIEKDKQIELRRALITAPQLVINRAYLYNETVLSQFYSQPGEEREAFKALLNQGVIIPFLFNEDSPLEAPQFSTAAFEAWKQICLEVRMKCTRLSWGNNNQQEIYNALKRRFHEFAKSASSGDIERYLRDLDLLEQAEDEEAKKLFQKRLRAMRDKCTEIEDDDKLVTREDLYKAFVTVDGTDPFGKQYDRAKPFASELKQLIDLSYNINLSDALDGLALTPVDSLPRSALQEWKKGRLNREDFKDAQTWIRMLRNSAFERLQQGLYLQSLLQDGYLSSLGSLTLKQVRQVRNTDEWAEYMQKMDALLTNPENFEQRAEEVFYSYIKLGDSLTKIATGKETRIEKTVWTPGIEYILQVSGASLTVRWSNDGAIYKLTGKISQQVAKSRAPYVEKLRIAGSHAEQADLDTTIEIKKGYTDSPGEQWEYLQRKVAEISGFHRGELVIGDDATLNIGEE